MPEGDVVYRTAQRLHAALAGREVVASDLRWPSLATVDLSGRTVLEVVPRGKHLLMRLDGDPPVTLHSHLRMEGSWHVHATGQPWGSARRRDGIRAIVSTADWTAVGHLLGMLDLVATAEEHTLVGHLGPDLLGADWDLERALANLAQQPDRPIGEALLDQRNLAGIGTMFMAEGLFARRVNPWTPTARVPDLAGVITRTQQLMRRNLGGAIQTTTGDTRHGQRTYVHGRHRQPCRRCGEPVRVDPIGVAPQDRVAFYCPRCQPPAEPAAS
ncbi:DNA-formamidopyrimidine glycosylase family protein [Angustibacter sp. Root456]|uniref:DNA-formamidopyrimidine glycosylase family protein n=1 Tax=Angustibacter sp. Root456 TaxID=1736539 RepID=UPI0006F332FE|nr:DNA-formamidopyrimidine glycosylase family protein [Angustibacter sp. Root456]KQX63660.1 DNA glycosylase [Angustibacter sp. Root456]